MKLVLAIIRPEKLDATKEALVAAGINGITVSNVSGFGKQLGHKEVYRGVAVEARLLPKILLTLLVPSEAVPAVLASIRENAMTGEIGDGKIMVLSVEEAMRIRTGETGEASIG
jgi:nitrogen regulatory protein PII